jgi:hypothetical protein
MDAFEITGRDCGSVYAKTPMSSSTRICTFWPYYRQSGHNLKNRVREGWPTNRQEHSYGLEADLGRSISVASCECPAAPPPALWEQKFVWWANTR